MRAQAVLSVFGFLVVTTLFSTQSLATDCKKGEAVRKVNVVYETEGKKAPCHVQYVKEDGTDKTLFSAKAEDGYCEKKAGEFMEKLSGMGYNCER